MERLNIPLCLWNVTRSETLFQVVGLNYLEGSIRVLADERAGRANLLEAVYCHPIYDLAWVDRIVDILLFDQAGMGWLPLDYRQAGRPEQ